MILTRTPLRVSFLGGGTDYPQWFKYHDGAVLGTSINKYCYVMLHDGKSWHTFDLPSKSGLGSSSAYTVGLLRACTELDKVTISKLATTWEQDKMNGNVGSQDQYLCSLGGFRHLRFSPHGIRDSELPPEVVKPLEDYLMLFDTHQYRMSGDIIAHQLTEMKDHQSVMEDMVRMVDTGIKMLKNREYLYFGELLDASWKMKRSLSSYVSTPAIDNIYDMALEAGAVGGKLLGGGGGGFILFLAEPPVHEAVKTALSDLTYVPFQFETEGSVVLFRD